MNFERVKNSGLGSVALSYVIWGLLPLYWHLLAGVPSIFVLCLPHPVGASVRAACAIVSETTRGAKKMCSVTGPS